MALRTAGALVAISLLAGCAGGGGERRDGAIVFTTGDGRGAVDADGSGLRTVADPGMVSPDGEKRLLPDGRLIVGDDVLRVFGRGEADGFAWSPDSRAIAYRNLAASQFAVWKLDVATRRKTPLTRPPAWMNDGQPQWSPDGERVLFERGGDTWAVDAAGGEPWLLLEGARDTRWSPDGRWLAFVMDAPTLIDNLLVVAAADGHDLRAVSDLGAFTQFAWHPDGKALAFVSFDSGRLGLFVAEAPEFEPRRLLADVASAPAWSPSGRRLAIAVGTPPQIWVLDARSGRGGGVTPGGEPYWEPRGLAAEALPPRR